MKWGQESVIKWAFVRAEINLLFIFSSSFFIISDIDRQLPLKICYSMKWDSHTLLNALNVVKYLNYLWVFALGEDL